jgi:fibronectin-binding autotransporter adhesin
MNTMSLLFHVNRNPGWQSGLLRLAVILGGALLLLLGSAGAAQAAAIVVNSTADNVAVDGSCTLREAISAANTDAAVDGCTAGSGADTITFSVNGTITLRSELSLTSNMTIDGGGVITVSGDNAYRVFNISSGGVVTLTGLTIRDGFAADNGGGVLNDGWLLLESSRVISNTAISGGGIYNRNGGRATLSATTVISNNAITNGGGVFNVSSGSVVTITNGSLVQGNSAGNTGGGVYSGVDGSSVLISASTIAANSVITNGGGLYITNSSLVTLTNGTLVQENSAGNSGGGLYTLSGGRATIDASSVLSNSAVGSHGGGIYSGGTGGIALANGSVVQANRAGGRGGGVFVIDTNLVTIDASKILSNSAASDGGGLANTNQADLAVSGSEIALNTAGAAGGGIVNRDSGVLTVTNSSILTNSAATNGGGLYNIGSSTVVSMTGSTIGFNRAISTTAAGLGGGVYHSSGVMEITGSTVVSNTAGTEGGGFYNSVARLTLTSTTVRENAGSAGGIRNAGGRLTLNNSQIVSNTTAAPSYGGGLDSSSDSHNTIYASLFAGNTAVTAGAIYAEGIFTITNSAFSDNHGGNGVGGIRAINGAMTIINSTISGNSGAEAAGLRSTAAVNLHNTIIANSVSGADCVRINGTLNARNSLIEGGLACVNGTNTNNLTGDPALNADLTLSSGSTAINAGDNGLVPSGVTTDLAGNARIQQNIVDMGAYESSYSPTAATVGNFAAELHPDRVRLHWTTLNEVGLAGFHLYRGLDAAGPGERITAAPLPGQGGGGLEGFTYTYEDFTPRPAEGAVFYWLEEVHSSGEIFRHGPQQVGGANSLRVFLPLVDR